MKVYITLVLLAVFLSLTAGNVASVLLMPQHPGRLLGKTVFDQFVAIFVAWLTFMLFSPAS